MPFDSHIRKIFDKETVDVFHDSKVLLVGAGGIGCELLKDLITMNYGEIHILDLDTIDLSNLNRQFLFRQKDIKASKSLTAVMAVQHFSHISKLVAHHGNIMDAVQFPLSFFQQFDMIFNALDNLEARMYVNKVCLFIKTPLMESGTTGLKGQVQPIYPYSTECFACVPKSTPKTFPLCTIRSTPSKPVHCVTWSKNFLFPQLFGPDTVENLPQKGQDAEQDGEAADKDLMQEANELFELKRKVLDASDGFKDASFVDDIIFKVFAEDISKLLRIEDLWKSRAKPTPLDYGKYRADIGKMTDIENLKLSDQNIWTVQENLEIFTKATLRLTMRLSKEREIEFDKDDDDTLEFVVSASNIRSFVFGIPLKTKFAVKQIAGNIIPAVATTNAIMAGFSALSSIHYFINGKNAEVAARASKMIFDSSVPERFVNSSKLVRSNFNCKQCSITRGIACVDIDHMALGAFRDALLKEYHNEDDVSIATSDSRLLYDFDFDDNLQRPLKDFIGDGDVLLISDSEETLDHIELLIKKGMHCVIPPLDIPPFREQAFEEDGEKEDAETEDNMKSVVGDEVVVLDGDDDKISNTKRSLEDDDNGPMVKKVRMSVNDEEDPIILD
ncbi:hypothetical protein FOA43_001552 [Brettanomyces nanus]|uniref:Ubiquitin-activating enzyme E1-like n=1 Tax=Eeniella nana TaxID=13502 RepID=A0A875RU64_EENNA|nr:uncharacterized protein FOA43_001552 [Brettanomyces nanus]QPG74227.1 hypothetical protein FOA43_001552 [Brettanomyces nanus]